MNLPTIGYYDDSFGPGGTTRYLLSLVSGLDRRRFRPVLFAPERRPWHVEAEAIGMEVVTLRPARQEGSAPPAAVPVAAVSSPKRPPAILPWATGTAHELLTLRRFLSSRRMDVLHSNNAGAEVAPIAARLAGIPRVLATWHVDSTYDLDGLRGGWNYRALEMACMRSLHHAIAVSAATARDWVRRCRLDGIADRRITVIPNGVDAARYRRRVAVEEAKSREGLGGRLVIASMGRLEAAKGYEYLIRSLPAVIERRPEALVRIAGRGPLLAELQALAEALGVSGHVDFAGFTADVQGFLECADIYVQPSLCEAMPMSILEASAVGIPVVASDVGGVAECVIEGESGHVVAPRSPDALAAALLRLAETPGRRVAMADAAVRLVHSRFTVDAMVRRTEEIYSSLLA
jgi:glycosyltransferase involved in cell wall biosynthesis